MPEFDLMHRHHDPDPILTVVVLLSEILVEERKQTHLLHVIAHNTQRSPIAGFTFEVTSMLPIAPGFQPVITATPLPLGSVLAPSTSATTTSSDTVNAPISSDATGLVNTVAIPKTATVGATFTLTTTYTNADGSVATSTSQVFTIVAAPPSDITGFRFDQTT